MFINYVFKHIKNICISVFLCVILQCKKMAMFGITIFDIILILLLPIFIIGLLYGVLRLIRKYIK